MRSVVLVVPPSDYPPMGALYIAGALQETGYRVGLCRSNMCDAEFDALIGDANPDFVGFSVHTYPSIPDIVKKSRIVRDIGVPVVWGGTHATCLPFDCLEVAGHVVVGDGEKALRSVIDGINRYVGNLVHVCPFNDIDQFSPAWNLVNLNDYIFPSSHSVRGNNTSNPGADRIFYYLSTSRGCPFSCTFCYNSRKPKRPWRSHSVGWVKYQVECIRSSVNIDGIGLWDDYFFGNIKRAARILEYLKSNDIKFLCEARATELTPEFARWLKEMGCLQVFVGAESGSNDTLKRIKKQISVEDVMFAIETTCRLDLPLRLSFIYGFPGETYSEMLETKTLIEYAKTFPNVSISGPKLYTPYPGTEMYRDALAHGFVPPRDIAGWGRIHRSTDLELLPWLDEDKLSELVNFSEGV